LYILELFAALSDNFVDSVVVLVDLFEWYGFVEASFPGALAHSFLVASADSNDVAVLEEVFSEANNDSLFNLSVLVASCLDATFSQFGIAVCRSARGRCALTPSLAALSFALLLTSSYRVSRDYDGG